MRLAFPLAALLWLAVLPAGATEVYRWVDADGVVHLQDQPSPGAERIHVEAGSTYTAPPLPASAGAAKGKPGTQPEKKAGRLYETLEIVSPKQQETLWNIAGTLSVTLRVSPPLQPGHSVRLFLDDQPVEGPSPDALEYQLTNVFRGVHVLRAEIQNDQAQTLIQSSPVSVSVRQAAVITPGSR